MLYGWSDKKLNLSFTNERSVRLLKIFRDRFLDLLLT